MKCTKCQNTIPINVPFCAYCGAKTLFAINAESHLDTKISNSFLIRLSMALVVLLIAIMGLIFSLISNSNPKFPTPPPLAVASVTVVPPSVTAVVKSSVAVATAEMEIARPAVTANATPAPAIATPWLPTSTPVVATTASVKPATQRGKLLLVYTQNDGQTGIRKFFLSSQREEIAISDSQNVGQPSWASDGYSFFFVDESDKSTRLVNGPTISLLAYATNPSVSRNHQLITYIGKYDTQVYISNENGTNARQLTFSSGPKLGPSISPDGRKIAYSYLVNNLWQIWVMNIDGSNQHQVSSISEPARFPGWSPDSRQLVFNTTQADQITPKDIWKMDEDGSNARVLVTGGQNGRATWVEDYVFFNSDRDKAAGRSDIYAIKISTNQLTRITFSSNDFDYYNAVWCSLDS